MSATGCIVRAVHVLHVESKSYTYYLLHPSVTGGFEERGDRSRGESHPALAAAGAGEGDQHICGRQVALKGGRLAGW